MISGFYYQNIPDRPDYVDVYHVSANGIIEYEGRWRRTNLLWQFGLEDLG
jgi:hypothetical protein